MLEKPWLREVCVGTGGGENGIGDGGGDGIDGMVVWLALVREVVIGRFKGVV